ncbi:Asp-tRNA(Asn)/Glu-tRNA(Gln) amidotransferase subunit GatB [Mesoplasma lactucae]|uniref:Aspartyl/glutamyl-tRNA(Asn/Gln) amidotransferase subunit B n=1 Tax=Mesoplasma lactucae ATCC 49193 TaxID=81460 RepID=A0A291ISA2_9MOLU|nr:Asp-tRNA(Asn)/Glu-tRNA(Gln) amidotransferase subunit GatB [Mesoplasma lactucae]ATG97608.1 Asp-tRNA(Asn)/Glu-tRNA(Gln) amidotransferase GatCAB subunit B [Mesoplasma lactucae ATCC 49193]ATZ19931.1 aspartyl/glutamyl-tRNA amidotransferase subunit B [Mesoplasma lactucae ATCC 49193]MCL8216795.1 Aspartyl/glutamyl-tRNA(Asn/Gln) amidotransferase subunit B [Mesoplasma lactucae ATCC 49193]
MNNFEVIIGIENHVELKTKSKMFAPAPVSFGQTPNTMVSETDLGYPGALPQVNKEGVRLAILAVNALNMKIDTLLRFDRKNYFYPDLAKGYQITQQFFPIGSEGTLEIQLDDGTKKIVEIERLHIEEDTAQQKHGDVTTSIDYNRSGIGLVEIVTKPVLRSAEEAVKYVEKLRETLLFLGVSDVKMNEGSLRCDVNVSLRPYGTQKFSNKVEVKNLNSLANVRKAVEFEIKRQEALMVQGKEVEQETRRFDETKQETVSMRSKSDALDYRYFTDPNIAPIQLDEKWVYEVIANSPELADKKRVRYAELGLAKDIINVLLSSLDLTNFFEQTIKLTKDAVKVANYLTDEVMSELNKENKTINQIALTPANLAQMVNLIDDGTISTKHAKTVLPIIMESDKETPKEIVERLNLKLINDPKKIDELLTPIFEKNEKLIEQYDERPERVTKALMGQLMKDTQGNVNPDLAMSIIVKKIKTK